MKGDVYLRILQDWFMYKLTANEPISFIYQPDGAQPHRWLTMRDCLN